MAGTRTRATALLRKASRREPACMTVSPVLDMTEVGCGAVAQLGERLVRNEEVRGSIPLGSTKKPRFMGFPAKILPGRYKRRSMRRRAV